MPFAGGLGTAPGGIWAPAESETQARASRRMNDQTDRVRRHTPAEILRRIDNGTVTSLSGCDGSPAKTDRRLKELDEEGIPIVP